MGCAGGTKTRSRTKKIKAKNGGKKCSGSSSGNTTCNTKPCAIDCAWSRWAQWSSCSKSCGGGTKTRSRAKQIEAKDGGKECLGSSSVTKSCNTKTCAIDCVWSQWARWSSCSKSCGGGTKTRSRGKEMQAKYGGKECVGSSTFTNNCNTNSCPIDCVWDRWAQWSSCSK